MPVVVFLICAFIFLRLCSAVGEYRDRGDRIKHQTAEIDRLNKIIDDLKQNNMLFKKQQYVQRTEIDKLNKKIESLTAMYEFVQKLKKQQEIQQTIELAELNKRINTLKQDNIFLKKTYGAEYPVEIHELNETINNLTQDNIALKEQLEAQKMEIERIENERDTLDSTNKKLDDKLKEVTSKISEAASSYRELYKRLKLVESNEALLRKTLQEAPLGFPSLLQAIKIYDERVDEAAVQWLINKPHPALNAAETVKRETSKRREAEYECRQAKLLMDYYFSIFPDIEDRKEILSENIADIEKPSTDDEEDVSRRYLSDDEYRNLSDTERNQLALDRFWKRRKSKRLIGKLYEQYIGYLYEEKGYHVEYFGISKGLEDLGRDLICKNDQETLLIQCKNWSHSTTIYEKHIFQLFGTAYHYAKTNHFENVAMAFYTTTHLSDIARAFAKDFKITLYENFPLQQPFPIIKCNVNKNGGRIYHLPFDQQYDTVKIRLKEGDFYCETVAEAEKAGFRRAYRWHGAAL